MPRYLSLKIREAGRISCCVAAQRTACIVFLYLVAGIATAPAQTQRPVPSVETIVARMAQARGENRARFRSYIVTRDYKLFGKERETTKAQVTAEVSFVPPGFKKYDIQQASGSGLGKIIVNRMLARETEITRDYTSTDISPTNYDFRFVRDGLELNHGNRPFLTSLQNSVQNFLTIKSLPPPVFLDDHVRDLVDALITREPALAPQALTTTPDGIAFFAFTRIDDLVLEMTAERTLHTYLLRPPLMLRAIALALRVGLAFAPLIILFHSVAVAVLRSLNDKP